MADAHAALWAKLSRHGPQQPMDLSAASIHWHLGKSIPWFYGTGVAIGVPFLSLVPQTLVKLWMALFWAIWSIVYLWLSQRELESHARKFGSLTEQEVNSQVGDPWKVWIGCIIAVVIWIVGGVGRWNWPDYWLVEWTVIASAIITGFIEMNLTNAWVLRYQAAVAGQKRYEEERRV